MLDERFRSLLALALPDALDAGDGPFRQGAFLLLSARDQADGSVVIGHCRIIDPQVGGAGIVVVHRENHRFCRCVFSEHAHPILTVLAIHRRHSMEKAAFLKERLDGDVLVHGQTVSISWTAIVPNRRDL